jgi:hypothetical protein
MQQAQQTISSTVVYYIVVKAQVPVSDLSILVGFEHPPKSKDAVDSSKSLFLC